MFCGNKITRRVHFRASPSLLAELVGDIPYRDRCIPASPSAFANRGGRRQRRMSDTKGNRRYSAPKLVFTWGGCMAGVHAAPTDSLDTCKNRSFDTVRAPDEPP